MKSTIIAAIIKKHGQPVPSGGYELSVTDEMAAMIPLKSVIHEYHDPVMRRTVLHLSESFQVIDIKATLVMEPDSQKVPPDQEKPLPPVKP